MIPENVDRILDYLEHFDFDNFDDERYRSYKSAFLSIFNGTIDTPLGDVKIDNLQICRCRSNDKHRPYFENIKDLWYPDPKYAKDNRLNFKGDPLFYGSQNESVALNEMRPKVGDVFSILKIQLTSPSLRLMPLGGEAVKFAKIKYGTEYERVLLEFIARQCRKIVPPLRPEMYLPTMLFAKTVWANNFDGFVYESVPSKFKGLNFALKPSYVDNNYEFVESRMVRINQIGENGSLIVQCLALGSTKPNGDFSWKEVKNCSGHPIDLDLKHFL